MPAYWEKAIAKKAKDGFALIGLDGDGRDKAAWRSLERLLEMQQAARKEHQTPSSQ